MTLYCPKLLAYGEQAASGCFVRELGLVVVKFHRIKLCV